MLTKRNGVVVALALVSALAGAGFEKMRQGWLASVPEVNQTFQTARPRVVKVRDGAAEREATALRKRVAELERALAERTVEVVQKPTPVTEEPTLRAERPRRQPWDDRMAQMKKDDPVQYEEMQKRREEFRQNMEQRAKDRADFLDSVDVKNMSAPQRENHEKLLATVARVNELMALAGTPGAENTHDLRHEMGEAMASLGDLYGEERRYLFEETAKAVGYEGAEVSVFAEHMQTIIDNTTLMSGFGRHGGGRGGASAQSAER